MVTYREKISVLTRFFEGDTVLMGSRPKEPSQGRDERAVRNDQSVTASLERETKCEYVHPVSSGRQKKHSSRPHTPSRLEAEMANQIRMAGLPEPVMEFRAVENRRFRWDLAWPEHRLLLEIQGGTWNKGGHSSGAGVARDCEKGNLATLAGWKTLSVTTDQIRAGKALRWIQAFFGVAA